MSSYLRPRRGKKSTAIAQLTSSNPLKRGEIFFEVPDDGVGTGAGKIKMGDGVTAYADLPYFSDGSDVGTVLTQAQYNALTPEQKANGTYWISDASSGNIVIDNALSTTSMNAIANKPVAEAITQLNNDLSALENKVRYTTVSGETYGSVMRNLKALVDKSKLTEKSSLLVGPYIGTCGATSTPYFTVLQPSSLAFSVVKYDLYNESVQICTINGSGASFIDFSSNAMDAGTILEVWY